MSNAPISAIAGTQKIDLQGILADAERTAYSQVCRAAEAIADAAPGSQAESEARSWHERMKRETAAIAEVRVSMGKLLEASAGGLTDLVAMIGAADRGEVWVVNAGTRARLENLRTALAPFCPGL